MTPSRWASKQQNRFQRHAASEGGSFCLFVGARGYAMPFSSATFTSSVRFFTPSLA